MKSIVMPGRARVSDSQTLRRTNGRLSAATDRASRPSVGTAQRAALFRNEQPRCPRRASAEDRGQSLPGRYGAAILLHCASAACLSEATGIFAEAVRQACLALLSPALTFALLVVI